jgi:Carboxypeptidase regulatory-like domain
MQFGRSASISGLWRASAVCLLALATSLVSPTSFAQSITSGDITGTVTDPSGAVLSTASVTLKNAENGTNRTTATSGTGSYRFSLVPLGEYTITISAAGFQTSSKVVVVAVGQTITVDVQLGLATSATSVEVSEASATVQTENADLTTTFSSTEVADLPNPGNDMTAIAYTTPGLVMNTQTGYGNFSAFGLGGTANLFTINGMNDNDPYLNLNNSGATNLLLGANEVAEEAVVLNGYSGQYGQLPGANVNIVTKSGTNSFHGDAIWYWNGPQLNSNDFLNNAAGVPRPFDNANQWAASIGGPIWRNHTFFYFDTEGLRVLIPTASSPVIIPSPGFQSAILTNLQATNPGAVPFYQQMFKLYNGAPGVSAATPQPGTCGDIPGSLPGLDEALGDACASQFRTNGSNLTHEALYAGRVDQILGQNDRAYVRLQRDAGVQATYTDLISSAFNAHSYQPEMQGQIGETHTFGPNAVNQFVLGGQYYKAVFEPASVPAQRNTFPVSIWFFDGSGITPIGGEDFEWPQGRNVTEYQVVDDFSLTKGNHTIKAGMNYHRNDVTDLSFGVFTNPWVLALSTTDFYNGGGDSTLLYHESFPSQSEQPIALYMLGLYVEDDWKVSRNLKLNISLRADHNSNPVCQTNCFAELTAPFNDLSHDVNVPYNQIVNASLHQAYPATTNIVWQPRLGFAWSPFGSSKTVIRSGAGIFIDSFPAQIVDAFAQNTPQENSFQVFGGGLVPGLPGNLYSIAAAANQSIINGFKSGGTLASISAANPLFSPPSFASSDASIVQPRIYEWNLEVQQALPWNMLLSVNYAGNHGIYLPIQNNGVNGYCPATQCPNGFAGIPSAPLDARAGTVNQVQSTGVSSYNGLVVSLLRRFSNGFQFQFGYTYSHALDEISNGGFNPFSYDTNESLLSPEDPFNIRKYNYGNSDYDVRHQFAANYVWEDALRHLFHGGPSQLFGGWTVGGTINYRTGLPFTVVDGGASGVLNGTNLGGPAFAWLASAGPSSCGKSATTGDCFGANQFAPSASDVSFSGFSNQGRNEFRGPGYFDTDLSVMKNFTIRENLKFGLGVQAFNLFNHPNFDQPVNDISNSLFGTIVKSIGPPTSILGAFLNGDASPRIIQVKLQLIF